jgi:HlyD family secretion protein
VEQARAALQQAEARQVDVDVARREMEAARGAVEQAEAALATAKASRREVEVRAEELKTSQAALREAEASLNRARAGHLGVRASEKEVQVAAASLAQAQASLDDVEYSFRNTTIYAPRNGVVLAKHVEEGTVIPPGTALYSQGAAIVTLADVSKMYVMAKVDESDIGQVKVGQTAAVSLDVLPSRQLKGKVIKIYPQAEEEQEVVYYKARVQLLEVPPELRPGMTANVVITVARLDNVLKIPDAAIDRSEHKTRVEVLVEGKPVVRDIKVGLTNWTETQVVEGLKEGEEVVLPSAAAAEEGRREDRSRTARRTMMMLRGASSRGGGPPPPPP